MDYKDIVYTDVLIVGAGPSGLAAAIKLADMTVGKNYKIMVIEKGNNIGSHILSGAIIKPDIFGKLLPDVPLEDIPLSHIVTRDKTLWLNKKTYIASPITPPYMGNKGYYTASLGEVCRFMAKQAALKGVEIYTGFSVNELIYEDGKVIGAKTIDTGVDKDGTPMKNFQSGTAIKAKLIILAEGTRGTLTKKLISKYNLNNNSNQQIYSLGCKELWQIPEGRIKPGQCYHTMGYPLTFNQFGGGFIYSFADNKVAVGMVIGLDYEDPTFDIHNAFQVWKTHPFISKLLKDGNMIEYGAKTLPEGGLYAMPKLYTDNVMIVGDSAGFLLMPALKGVHPAIESGIYAAQTAAKALQNNDFSKESLKYYDKIFKESKLYSNFKRTRNFRQGFQKGLIIGGIRFSTQLATGGLGLEGRIKSISDAKATKTINGFKKKTFKSKFIDNLIFDKKITFDKVTDIYYSGTNHDEHQVPHLQINNPNQFSILNIQKFGAPCQYFCPADVYELHKERDGKEVIRIHAENCVHCKTCDIKSPGDGITWNLPYGGNGPDYQNM